MKPYIFVHNRDNIEKAIASYGDGEVGADTVWDAFEQVWTDWFEPNEPFAVYKLINGKWEVFLEGRYHPDYGTMPEEELDKYSIDGLIELQFGIKKTSRG